MCLSEYSVVPEIEGHGYFPITRPGCGRLPSLVEKLTGQITVRGMSAKLVAKYYTKALLRLLEYTLGVMRIRRRLCIDYRVLLEKDYG